MKIILLGALVAQMSMSAAMAQTYYSNNFENVADTLSEWSSTNTVVAPGNGERFLGRFAGSGAPVSTTLSLSSLPAETQRYRLQFSLYVTDSWDGEGPNSGPDTFGVRVNGVERFRETFNNMDGDCCLDPWGVQGQSYGPAAVNPPRTGASATNTLMFPTGGFWGARDSTYTLSFEFDHTGPNIAIEFFGQGLQDVNDESWGIDNVSLASSVSGTSAAKAVPTLSQWAITVIALVLAALGAVSLRRRN